jgi:hypothetical protein
MADRRVLHLPAGLDGTHHDFTGVDPDTGFERMRALRDATLPSARSSPCI